MTTREELEKAVAEEKAEWERAAHINAGAGAISAYSTLAAGVAAALAGSVTLETAAFLGGKMVAGNILTHFTGLNEQAEKTEYKAATHALHHADAVGVALADHEVAAPSANLPIANANKEITIT